MWSLFESGKKLEPLKFSNGKTQEDIVNEVVSLIKAGEKVIFIRGVCGTGKSAIALNIAKEVGKASIVVPVKNLQKQYEQDYTDKKYLLKDNGEKVKIAVITGRQNFSCPFIKDYKINKKEKNSTLNTFNVPEKDNFEKFRKNKSCDNIFLPCKIELVEKNIDIIRDYVKQNPNFKKSSFYTLKDVKRLSIAPICPFYSPLMPSHLKLNLDNDNPREYLGLENVKYTFHKRLSGCGYYDQYQAYIDSDVIIFNSHKYKLETAMNRKPASEIEIIDECDEFLDSFSSYNKINLNRFYFSLSTLFSEQEKVNEKIKELGETVKELLKTQASEEIVPLKETRVVEILKEFSDSNLLDYVECDEENYCYHVDEVSRLFQDFLDDSYVSFSKETRDLEVRIITTSLEKRFKEVIDKNKTLVLMSGTIHSPQVLKDVFGISNFKIIDAETLMPGTISELRTGLEIDCRYENFRQGRVTREQYLIALNKCVVQAPKPCLVHVNSFADLPTGYEKLIFNLNLMSQEELKEFQYTENVGEQVKKFKNKEISILYSTKCNRGVDFPGETCNSIILTKYPYPNIQSLFWKILRKTHPEYYNEFYIDKSRREFLQRVYRGLRSRDDHIFLLSPDIRVFQKRL